MVRAKLVGHARCPQMRFTACLPPALYRRRQVPWGGRQALTASYGRWQRLNAIYPLGRLTCCWPARTSHWV